MTHLLKWLVVLFVIIKTSLYLTDSMTWPSTVLHSQAQQAQLYNDKLIGHAQYQVTLLYLMSFSL